MARGFFGDGQLPWNLVSVGVFIGLALVSLDTLLEKRQASYRLHLMPIAVGMYLPFGLSVPIFLGGILSALLARKSQQPTETASSQPGVLLASGAIAGEALTGVGIALFASFGLSRLELGLSDGLQTGLTVVALLGALVFLYRGGRQSTNESSALP